jgi:Rieske Fe-S protein
MPSKYRSPVMDRRSFVKVVSASLGSLMATIIGLPMIQYFISPALGKTTGDEWISLGLVDNYPFDQPTLFNFTITKVNGWERSSHSYGAFVLRKEGQDPVVFSDVCTHLSCRVNWDETAKKYNCPCHAAFFDQDGGVVSGPPPRSLDRFEIRLDGDQLFIHLTEG